MKEQLERSELFAPLRASAVVFYNDDVFLCRAKDSRRERWLLPGDLAKPDHRPSSVLNEHLYKTIGWTFQSEWIHFTGGIIVRNDPEKPNIYGRDFIINYYWLDLSNIRDFMAPAEWVRIRYECAVDENCSEIFRNDRAAIRESQILRQRYYAGSTSDRFIT